MKIIGKPDVGIDETTQGVLDINANNETIAVVDSRGIKPNYLVRHKAEIPSGTTWELGASGVEENAVLVGPVTVTGSLTITNGTLVII